MYLKMKHIFFREWFKKYHFTAYKEVLYEIMCEIKPKCEVSSWVKESVSKNFAFVVFLFLFYE